MKTILPLLVATLCALAACATTAEPAAEVEAAPLPEVRYYLIADT